jgi:signal peptidase I
MTILKNISEHLLSDGLSVRLKTRGFSMFPLISTGDRIIIRQVRSLSPGDVIVFKRNDEWIGHRLRRLFMKDGIIFLQTKGDNQFQADEPITPSEILGKVIEIDRGAFTFTRKMLLACYPLLRFGYLNAILVAALIQIRKLFACRNDSLMISRGADSEKKAR